MKFHDYGLTTPRAKPKKWKAKSPPIPGSQRHKYEIALQIGCAWGDLEEIEDAGLILLDGKIVAVLSAPCMGGNRWRVTRQSR